MIRAHIYMTRLPLPTNLFALVVVTAMCLAFATMHVPTGQLGDQPDNESTDLYGDPLPHGAVARLGTLRYRHESWVRGVAFSPDGSVLASGADSIIRFWDADTGKKLLQIDARYRHERIGFSPDGKIIASSNGTRLYLWNSRSGENLLKLPNFREHFSFSPDSTLLATGFTEQYGRNARGQLRVWEIATGREFRTLDVDTELTAFSPDGELLVAGGGYTGSGPDKPLVLLHAQTGKIVATLAPPEGGGATSVLFSPDGKLLVTSNCVVNRTGAFPWKNPSAILVWTVPNGNLVRRLEGGTGGSNDALAISPDGETLAVGRWVAGEPGRNEFLSLWNITTGEQLRKLLGNEKGHFSVAFSPDGKTLASVGADHTVRRWNVSTGEEIITQSGHESRVDSISFSPDGKTLASAGADQTIRFWDVATGRQLRKLSVPTTDYPYSLAFLPDGTLASAAGYALRPLRLWDTTTGHELPGFDDVPLSGARALAVAPDGKTIATAGVDNTVRVWDVATGKEIHRLKGHQGQITCIAFSPDGRTVASGGGGDHFLGVRPDQHYTILLWDAVEGKELRRFGLLKQWPVSSLAFSPDGKTLASGGYDPWESRRSVDNPDPRAPSVYLWDPATGRERLAFGGPAEKDRTRSVVFAPDGKVLAAAHSDRTVRFWNVATGKLLDSINDAHPGDIGCMAFSPNGNRLATGSDDTTILIWDVSRVVR